MAESLTPWRPLQISFIIDLTRGRRLHETELIDHLDDLPGALLPHVGAPVNGSVPLDGSISLLHQGREQLGVDYWFELSRLTSWSDLVCHGREEICRYGQSSRGIRCSPQGAAVLLEAEAARDAARRRCRLPLQELVREWVLMQVRLARVGRELGDLRSTRVVDGPLQWLACARMIELVGRDRLVRTAAAPLAAVLTDPVPF